MPNPQPQKKTEAEVRFSGQGPKRSTPKVRLEKPSTQGRDAQTFLPYLVDPSLKPSLTGACRPPRYGSSQTVFERIGSPPRIPSADEIPEGRLPEAVREMHRRFVSRGIHLATLSPNVGARELYEFMTGEFLGVRVATADSPMLHCFVYDAFRPDPWHTNERRAVDYCIRVLLQKENRLHMFPNGRPITVNRHRDLTESGFRRLMQAFRSSHSDIVCIRAEAVRTTVKDELCLVSGTHVTGLCSETCCNIVKGGWTVEFERSDAQWLIRKVVVEGVGL